MKKQKYDLAEMKKIPPKDFVIYSVFFCTAVFFVLLCCSVMFLSSMRSNQTNKEMVLFLSEWGSIFSFFISVLFLSYSFMFWKQKKYFKLINKKYFDGQMVLLKTLSNLGGFDYLFLILDLRDWNQDKNLRTVIDNVIGRANGNMSIFGSPLELCLYNQEKHHQLLKTQNLCVCNLFSVINNHLVND